MDFVKETKQRVCELMYSQNAVKTSKENVFELKGGILSPVFFNVGVLEIDFATRSSIASALHILLTRNHDFEAVVGVVSGGVSWASNIANSRALPLIRVHGEKKEYGLFNQIEGGIPYDGIKVLVVDDAITSGDNAKSVVEVLRKGEKDAITSDDKAESIVEAPRKGESDQEVVEKGEGDPDTQENEEAKIKRAQVIGLCTIFDWDFPAVNEKFFELGVPKFSLVKFQEVLDYGFEHGYLSEDVRPAIEAFCQQYR